MKRILTSIGYTNLHFSFTDRVRILFGKVPSVTIKTSLNADLLPEDFTMETEIHVPRIS
jgi:hypothetical protein